MRLVKFILRRGENPLKLTLMFSLPFIAALLVMLAIFGFLENMSIYRYFQMQLMESARAYFNQIELTRLWNTQHGGVYVEVTEQTPPNPYLKDPERDIVSLEGRKFTKINPAYMSRQISEIALEKGMYKFHLTSLRPINPNNRPDEWEAEILRSFRQGREEGYGTVMTQGEKYFGYMAPLRIEKPCLKCHQEQGYRIGDIRGGISIYIPLAAYEELYRTLRSNNLLTLSVIGLFCIFTFVGIVWFFSSRLSEGMRKELESQRLKSAVHLAEAAAHELRQPMSIIMGFHELIKDRASEFKEIDSEMEIVLKQCRRMNDIITRMLNVTRYKTKTFGDRAEIFDLGPDSEFPTEDIP